MKKIVVPIDFSEDSLNALRAAVGMARTLEAEITLIHVIKVKSIPIIGGNAKPIEDSSSVETNFKDVIAHIEHDGVNMDYVIKTGKVAREITDYAEACSAYMIVMGTHGASGFEEFWAGSNAYRVVSSASCPVLTMRGNHTKDFFKKILLPIDLSDPSREKVPFTADLARIFDAEVHVLGTCVDESDEFANKLKMYINQVSVFLGKKGVINKTDFVVGDNVTTMARDYADEINADLVCIMTEQELTFVNTFLGPYAQQMVNHSTVPVLSMQRTHNAHTGASF